MQAARALFYYKDIAAEFCETMSKIMTIKDYLSNSHFNQAIIID